MRKLLVFIKISFIDSLAERGDVFLYALGNFVTPVIIMTIWLVINKEGTNTLFTYNQLIVYYLASVLVATVDSSWVGQFIPGRIRRGDISSLLLKPMPFLTQWIGQNIGEKFVKLIFLTPSVLLLGLFLSAKIPNLGFTDWLLVSVSILMGGIIVFLLDILVGMAAFWMEETRSLQELFGILESLFSGKLIPLALLPLFWEKIAFFLPFRYFLSFPLEILLKQLTTSEILAGLFMQSIYLLLIVVIYRLVWSRGIKLYSASGA